MARVKNYINNKTLYESLIEYKAKLREAEVAGTTPPQVPNYIGEALDLICNNLVKKGNFSGYTLQWKQEMVSDGLIDCISAVDNFKPEKTDNPFAYFTMIAWNAFIRRITKEKKQTYIKHKNFENSFLMNALYENGEFMQLEANEYSSEIVKNFEDKLTKAKKDDKVKGVEQFTESEILENEVSNSL